MSQVSIESTTAPMSADKNPETTNPGTISVIAQKSKAFKMSEKSPKVIIVIGSVSSFSTGRITMVITDHTSATRSVVTHPPVLVTPGTRLIVKKTAATVPRYFSTIDMLAV